MRILHLSDHYPPVLGGIENHVAELAQRQAARGDEVTVLTSTAASAEGWHSDDHGPVTVRRVASTLEGARTGLDSYDVVHAHMSVWAPFAAPLAAMTAHNGTPTLITVHSLWNWLGPVPAVAAGLHGILRAPVQWTAVSHVAADQVSRRLPGRPSVGVLTNAVELSPRGATPRRSVDAPVRLVTTMRIARRKRPLPMLRMFEQVRDSSTRPVSLTIVGEGPQRPRVEEQLRRRGLEQAVHLTGRLDAPQVREHLDDADLYVAPAVLESFGLAALEARCAGLPVVGYASSGLSEFIAQGQEGWLCESDADMVSRLRWLVDDDEARREISEHNRRTLPGTTWARTMDEHDEAYSRAAVAMTIPSRRTRPLLPSRAAR